MTTAALLAGVLLGTISGIQRPPEIASAATANEPYTIDWYTIDAGGASPGSPNGGYTLGGTIGQHDAGAQAGGQFTLEGGFWGGIDPLFLRNLPLVQR